MRSALMLTVVVGALLVSVAGAAEGEQGERGLVRCGSIHTVRSNNAGGLELFTGTVTFRNFDLQEALVIERLTFRNVFGTVIHDSGPAIGVPHPLNVDFVPALDITVVPPGASYYLSTNHIWGNSLIPGDGGNQQGNSASIVIEFSKAGKIDAAKFTASLRARRLLTVFSPTGPLAVQGEELTRLPVPCYEAK